MSRIPLEVETRESAPDGTLADNILTNIKLIPYWIQEKYIPHSAHALMISAGHSFTNNNPRRLLADFFTHPHTKSSTKIFTVKHALPYFEKLAIKPDYCVALDPRPLDDISTLGSVRRDLYKIYPETTYLVASMTHPSVTNYLLDNGAKVVGWHSYCAGSEHESVKEIGIPSWVYGGSCSAMRSISIAKIFGFREVSLLGYDCSFTIAEAVYHLTKNSSPELRDALGIIEENGIPVDFQKIMDKLEEQRINGRSIEEIATVNYLTNLGYRLQPPSVPQILPVNVGDYKCWISGEMAALVKDLENLFRNNHDMTFHNLSGGFCKAVFDALDPAVINPVDFFGSKETE